MLDVIDSLKECLIIPRIIITPDTALLDTLLVMQHTHLSLIPILNENQEVVGGVFKDTLLFNIAETQSLNHSLHDCIVDVRSCSIKYTDLTFETLEALKCDLIIVEENGKFIGIITKESATQLCFKRNKAKIKELDAIFNSALAGLIILGKDRTIKKMNPAAAKIAGLIPEKTIGKLPERVGFAPVVFGVDYMHKKFHNGRVYIASGSPIIIDNEITGSVNMFLEVTESEETIKKLTQVQELNHELETIIHSSFDGIVVTDANGKVLKINKSAMDLLELDISQTDNDCTQLPTWFLKLANDVKLDPITYTTRNETENELIITATPVCDQGNINRFVFNIRDITELTVLKSELSNSKRLSRKYHQELERLKNKTDGSTIARSKKMANVVDLALKMAQVDTTLLILGETGVGKQLIAKTVHDNSLRKNGPFIDINCGAIPEALLESELFGYEPGAFTGGVKSGKLGLFECANEGTIFLDEIGDLPYLLQVKLLKVLQNHEVLMLGGRKPRKINTRVIAATNKNLAEMVRKGSFREDLFYRLNIVPITIPPLRERKEDILPLIHLIKTSLEEKYNNKVKFTTKIYEILLKYDWPGNVRELQNLVERLVVTAHSSVVDPRQLLTIFSKNEGTDIITSVVSDNDNIIPLKEAIELLENKLIQNAMRKFGSTYKAAKALGLNQSTVARKAKKLKNQFN